MSFLTEEEIDDVLYCARANDLEELKPFISTLDTKYASESPASIILAAVDSETGNNAAHYASGNGHQGTERKQGIFRGQGLTVNVHRCN